jgi:hypothetical protein
VAEQVRATTGNLPQFRNGRVHIEASLLRSPDFGALKLGGDDAVRVVYLAQMGP